MCWGILGHDFFHRVVWLRFTGISHPWAKLFTFWKSYLCFSQFFSRLPWLFILFKCRTDKWNSAQFGLNEQNIAHILPRRIRKELLQRQSKFLSHRTRPFRMLAWRIILKMIKRIRSTNTNRDTDLSHQSTLLKPIYSAYDRNHSGFGGVNCTINHSPKMGRKLLNETIEFYSITIIIEIVLFSFWVKRFWRFLASRVQ